MVLAATRPVCSHYLRTGVHPGQRYTVLREAGAHGVCVWQRAQRHVAATIPPTPLSSHTLGLASPQCQCVSHVYSIASGLPQLNGMRFSWVSQPTGLYNWCICKDNSVD